MRQIQGRVVRKKVTLSKLGFRKINLMVVTPVP